MPAGQHTAVQRFAAELRSAAVDGSTLAGHAAVFGQVADLGLFGLERLAPTAFNRALDDGADPRFLLNHDPSRLLGRRSSGTLRVGTDDDGLNFEVDLPDTEDGRTVRELCRRGDLTGCSFGFIPGDWQRDEGASPDGRDILTHTSIRELFDLSVVTYPAYDGTQASLRAIDLTPRRPGRRAQLIRARHAARYPGGGTA